METISGRGRMQVSTYPQMFPRPTRTRNRSPQVWKYSANRLRSYASRGKIACSISRILSMSDRRKRLKVNSEGILLSFYFGALGAPGKPLGSKKRGKKQPALDKHFGLPHTGIEMQLSGNYQTPVEMQRSLVDLRRGDAAILDGIDLPGEEARRLMELGFLPGMRITAGRSAPGGDPQVFQVDGSEIALRRETARRLKVRREKKVAKPVQIPGA